MGRKVVMKSTLIMNPQKKLEIMDGLYLHMVNIITKIIQKKY